MKLIRTLSLFVLTALLTWPAAAASKKEKEKAVPSPAPTGPATFAPLPADHALAPVWNDPDFTRRLVGGYGFLSEAEPKLSGEELQFYTNKIVPLLQGDRRKEAIPLLDVRVKQPGANAQFDYLLGTIQFENEDLTNAVKNFENALAKAKDFRRAQRSLGLALARSERYEEAIKPLVRTISLGGGDGGVYGVLGFCYLNQNRFTSAEGAYKQALVFEPEKKDFKLALVRCAVGSGNYDYALALLDEVLQQYPAQENLWTLQANIYIKKDQPTNAVIGFEMARRLGKATADQLFTLGDLYMTQEARELALEVYLEAIEKDGGQKIAKALRPAQILVSRSAWDEARKLFAKIRASSGLAGADELKLLKLESKVMLATGEGEKAIQTLEEIVGKNPLDGEALLLAGDYYARHEQPEKAQFKFDAASKLDGFEADGYLKYAQLLVQSQKYPQAVEMLRKAQKAKPRDNVQRYLEKVEQLARAGRS
jgi:tetratricopeptide (TPR) repeat protein